MPYEGLQVVQSLVHVAMPVLSCSPCISFAVLVLEGLLWRLGFVSLFEWFSHHVFEINYCVRVIEFAC